ncbi:Abi family protein [Hufsiella ginkgonis]|uniref:Abi family protein n=1 Tax=Hufsiella ginkgonis TaxID=2695274 RepID=A0A7K1XVK7_9SPHI|nr:Abi family protein [Hufsiella ginkgonis]MXV14799.1 Abi family protein [Hufsiella ginkgonis]
MYSKNATSINEQIDQLIARGLEIPDRAVAAHYLANISYYRLAGYWWPMQADKVSHTFKPSSQFDAVIALYNFDRDLRLLVFDVIERIEIALRTRLIYHLSHECSPWWFQDTSLFINVRELTKTLASLEEELERSKDVFIKEHLKKHKDDMRFPPAWKSLEITSFGSLSKLYGNLKHTIKSKDLIAQEFQTANHTYLPSWLQAIAQIRNICAHHGRLWNKNLPGTPKLMSKPPKPWIADVPTEHEFKNLYIHLCCMRYLLNVVNPGNSFSISLQSLFTKYPTVDEMALGMKSGWRNEDLWRV